jgi:hypothetical protein
MVDKAATIGGRISERIRNWLLELLLTFIGLEVTEDNKHLCKMEEEWNELYDSIVKLVGNNIVYVNNSTIKCYVKEGKHAWMFMNVEKLRTFYKYEGFNGEPIDEIWVTVNDGLHTMRTLAIPRKSNGKNTDIMDVDKLFKNILKLFSSPNASKDDETWANEALE